MVLAVAAILDIVNFQDFLLTQEAGHLGTGDVESLPAAVPVARHARSRGCLALPALLLADVAGLVEAVVRNVLQDDGLHGQHVGKLHLWDVQSTHNVGPPSVVGPFQGSIFVGAQFTSLEIKQKQQV